MNAIKELLSSVELSAPLTSGPIFLFPVIGLCDVAGDELTLEEGLSSSAILISETSEDGFVPELLVCNRSTRPLFLLDGEQVVGLKQNRTFNLSMLLPPVSRTVVPVSCVEQGRWFSRAEPPRAAEHVHFAKGRANKLRSVGRNLAEARSYRSNQSLVWGDIEERFQRSGSSSPTCAEADYFEERRRAVEQAAAAFRPEPRQVGALFGAGNRVIGLDLFGSPKLYRALHDKLLRSYLVDEINDGTVASPPPLEDAFQTLKNLLDLPAKAFPSPGLGEARRLEGQGAAGAMLVVDDKCVHAVALLDA